MGKSKTISFILCCGAFIGLGGLHDFYLKRYGWGIAKLLTFDFLWIGAIYDLNQIRKNQYEGLRIEPATTTIDDEPLETKYDWSVGSESQKKWADEILERFTKKTEKLIAESQEKGKITEEESEVINDKIADAIYEHDDANWWIDTRNDSLEERLKEMLDNDTEAIDILKKMAK